MIVKTLCFSEIKLTFTFVLFFSSGGAINLFISNASFRCSLKKRVKKGCIRYKWVQPSKHGVKPSKFISTSFEEVCHFTQPTVQPFLQRHIFGTSAQNICKNRYQFFSVFFSFFRLFNFYENALHMIAKQT